MKLKETILIVDDEPQLRHLYTRLLELEGYEVFQATDCASAFKQMESHHPLVVLCDVFLPDGSGLDMLVSLKQKYPTSEIILLTAYGNIADGVTAIKRGAFDYMTKGNDNNKIIPVVSRAFERAQTNAGEEKEKKSGQQFSFDTIIGQSEAIRQSVALAAKVAKTDVSVLLTGETGTGKELFAEAIHNESKRADKQFVAINCSAFSKDLLESELFGYKAGAFTGAVKDKKGLIEIADDGTLFLDEIGEMAFELQAKLLRVLESGEFFKIGDTKTSKSNLRVIAATNRDLRKEITNGHFREDLFYRLSVFSLHLPPLRERVGDVEILSRFFVKELAARCGSQATDINGDALKLLAQQPWNGNIRELRNIIERALIVCEGNVLTTDDLPVSMTHTEQNTPAENGENFAMAAAERRHIIKVLQYTGGNKTEAARLMKIGLTTLYRKMEEYGI